MRTKDKLKKSAVKSKSSLIMDSYWQVRNKVNALNIRLKPHLHYAIDLESLSYTTNRVM